MKCSELLPIEVHAVAGVLLVLASVSASFGQEKSGLEGLSEWATLPADGPKGRPLPLAGSWMAEKMYGPQRSIEMIEGGHHILITFLDPIHLVRWTLGENRNKERYLTKIEEYYRPGLEYAKSHHLPIAFRGWNWGDSIGSLEERKAQAGLGETSLEETTRMVIDGEKIRLMDPFGPIAGWEAFGEAWGGNEVIAALQQIYPDPPMVVWLNNNEGPRVRRAEQLPDDYPRFVAIHGVGPHSKHEKEVAIREGYHKRYKAMFGSFREALSKPAWKKHSKLVAYNSLWDAAYIGRDGRPRQGIGFEPGKGWLEWRIYDGTMPEMYDNDWQPGKADHRPWSPQIESMGYASVLERLFQIDPDVYWSSIVWEGGRVADVWRGRRGSSKTYHYITRGQRWDFARYEGWVQYGMWITRPRAYREFRWPPSDRHAYDEACYMAVVNAVDRPWNTPTLRRFWRFGELVDNPDEEHPWPVGEDQPQWVKKLERWYMLTCDANPPRKTWQDSTELCVFALALQLGEAPEREWVVYAHAPLGAVASPTVELPGYGELQLESVPKSGSFWHVKEASRSVTPILVGGPAELSVRTEQSWANPGQSVTIDAGIAHAHGMKFREFIWDFGDGGMQEQSKLTAAEHTYNQPGQYIITVTAQGGDGQKVIGQNVVNVGDRPEEAVVYHLPLDGAMAWKGPWSDSGAPEHRLVSYRHLPNMGSAPMPVVAAARFVDDAQRGSVLELAAAHDAVWLLRGEATMMDKQGHAYQTISMWFKPNATEGRQVLYAQGFNNAGFNIYLDGDTLYAGSWAPAESMDATGWYPVWGRGFPGYWLRREGIEAGKWYHVAVVLDDADDAVADGKQKLYVNDELVATGPGVKIPRQYAPPRIGRSNIGDRVLTKFHDDANEASSFRGRIDDFRFTQTAEAPSAE